MRTIFIADDGRQFDYQDECEEYEFANKMKDKFPTTRFFNSRGKPMQFIGTAEFCDDISYFDVRTKEEAELLHQFFIDCGFVSPWRGRSWHEAIAISTGYYFYDTDEEKWRNLEELYNKYREILDVFKRG